MSAGTEWSELPGGILVEKGLRDVRDGRTTVESLLVAIARPRLQALGVLTDMRDDTAEAELALYALLGREGTPDPYSRYNALLRELTSCVHALEHRAARERAGSAGALAPGPQRT